jgi:hypothetical protein
MFVAVLAIVLLVQIVTALSVLLYCKPMIDMGLETYNREVKSLLNASHEHS